MLALVAMVTDTVVADGTSHAHDEGNDGDDVDGAVSGDEG